MDAMQDSLGTVVVIEKIRRLLFNVIERELHDLKIYDVTPIQLMMMYDLNLSQKPSEAVSARLHLGANPIYSVKKSIAGGYITRSQSEHDHRNLELNLSNKGVELYQKIESAFSKDMNQAFKQDDWSNFSKVLLDFLDRVFVLQYAQFTSKGS